MMCIDTATILVVDDEPGIVEVLTFALDEAGFSTLSADDGPTALRVALTQHPDLVLLDIMLPGIDGLEICRQLRASSDVAIILVSAKGSEAERIAGLELFADDYIVKPFSLAELIARVKTVLHRTARAAGQHETAQASVGEPSVLQRGLLVLDHHTFVARWNGNQVDLTRIQFDLLATLARRPGVVFPRTQLLTEVWGHEYVDDVRTVDSMVKRLRQKLREAGAPNDLIDSRRDRGYLVRADLLDKPADAPAKDVR
jgi:two-component system, OmpR family, response regulator VicR